MRVLCHISSVFHILLYGIKVLTAFGKVHMYNAYKQIYMNNQGEKIKMNLMDPNKNQNSHKGKKQTYRFKRNLDSHFLNF